jgi:hypothetical protein
MVLLNHIKVYWTAFQYENWLLNMSKGRLRDIEVGWKPKGSYYFWRDMPKWNSGEESQNNY